MVAGVALASEIGELNLPKSRILVRNPENFVLELTIKGLLLDDRKAS